jgi:hypothetical protein
MSYRWRFNGADLVGQTNAWFWLPSVGTNKTADYCVVVTNSFGAVTSQLATLTVVTAPVIVTNPQDSIVLAGETAVFTVTAVGALPLTYQWRLNGTNILANTNLNLALTNVQANQAGYYSVLIRNSYGSALSRNALLTVIQPS